MIELKLEDIKHVILRVWRERLPILIVTLAGALIGIAMAESFSDTYTYRATATVCVTYTMYQEQIPGSTVLTNYSEVVTSNRVCEYAEFLLDAPSVTADRIKSSISTTVGNSSYVMRITAAHEHADMAVRIANAVAEAYVIQITAITGSSAIQLLDMAKNVSAQTGNERRNITLLTTVGAFLLACAVAAYAELRKGVLRSIAQCEAGADELLTIIPFEERGARRPPRNRRGASALEAEKEDTGRNGP